jgi:hypothetical protein
MRRFIGYAAMAMIGFGLTTACAVSTEGADGVARDESTVTAESVAALTKGAGTAGDLMSIDLSRPDVATRFDTTKGSIDLARVRVVSGKESVALASLVQTAEKASGLSTPRGGFVLRSAESSLRWPGGGKCSPATQTDCCECGWWSTGGTTIGRESARIGTGPFDPICLGFWCPVTVPF